MAYWLMLLLLDDAFDIDTFFGIFGQGFIAGIVGIFAGIGILKLLKSKELHEVWKSLHSKFWKATVISSE